MFQILLLELAVTLTQSLHLPVTSCTSCPTGAQKIGTKCYSACPSGYERVGNNCHTSCPVGWPKDQQICYRLTQYQREFSDMQPAKDSKDNQKKKKRCQSFYGIGNCEQSSNVWGEKCRQPGYKTNSHLCTPIFRNCYAAGMEFTGTDYNCDRKIINGKTVPCAK